jgi:hypothetical protein
MTAQEPSEKELLLAAIQVLQHIAVRQEEEAKRHYSRQDVEALTAVLMDPQNKERQGIERAIKREKQRLGRIRKVEDAIRDFVEHLPTNLKDMVIAERPELVEPQSKKTRQLKNKAKSKKKTKVKV